MKIGLFDSGLGGLVLLRAITKKLPQYDYVYLGDTKRVPYGNRSQATIYEFTRQAVEFLFKKDCRIVIVACNTASAAAVPKIQQEYLPKRRRHHRVLGIIRPTAEVAAGISPIGILATESTVSSHTYIRELKRFNKKTVVWQQAAPLLVPLAENDGGRFAAPILKTYLAPLLRRGIKALILGCTHYPLLKRQIARLAPGIKIISQDELVPDKLADYLKRHPEIESKLTKRGKRELLVTDLTEGVQKKIRQWFGRYRPQVVHLSRHH